MKKELEKIIKKAILDLFKIKQVNFNIDHPAVEKFGDYTTNAAMVLGKMLKKNPMEIAKEIVNKIKCHSELVEESNQKNKLDPSAPRSLSRQERGFAQDDIKSIFEKVEVVAPGYINFYLSEKYLQDKVAEINKEQENFGNSGKKNEKIMVEYSQPNTHKEFHVGHLRNVFIGSSIVNVLKKNNYEVVSANYIGDTGSHIAKCLWGIVKFHASENLEEIKDKANFLGKVYSEAVSAIEENGEYEKEFKDLQNKFEAGDEQLVSLWKKTRQWSLDEFYKIYEQLGVIFDTYFFESEEEVAGKKILPELLEKGIVKVSQEAVIADLEQYGLGVLVLQRGDGSALYGLKDIPLAIKKFEKYGIDRSVYVIDVRQSLYFRQLFKILELYGFQKEMIHVGYDFVSLKDGESMSSRKGNIIPGETLIKEVVEKVKEKFPNSPHPEEIGLGAIRFFMLKYSAESKIEFDMNEAIRLDGATGPYVQYAHARIHSILAKSQFPISNFQINPKSKNQNFKLDLLTHPKELSLIKELDKFPELVEEIAESYEVHKLPHYAIRLADKFHSFYNDCRVIDEENPELTEARLNLINAVRIVLSETLRIIGVNSPEKM